jgi:hypothetical protein
MGTGLTVLARSVGGICVHVLMMPVVLYFLDDLIEEIVEKFVCVLVHCSAKEFIAVTELVDKGTWGNGALICRISGNVHVERAESGEESRRS